MTELKGIDNKATRRALNIINVLKGHSINGLSNGEIAERLNDSPVNITRALAILVDEGFAQKLPTGRFTLSVRVLQVAEAYRQEWEKMQLRMTEIDQRVRAGTLA
ncbi:IclR family transcriptional regulator [Mannheimia granulomatis]|uniref:IclR family transcriptional regulator n=1 Tax=Mannheimia granulomatis TaxID=85402 RepID=UPI00159E01B5|nr:IclR family transcriptional regulator [Mannheimia granulomatis]QLB15866.1 IclR family transcriptional regulator [Mannheimia granulomatis]